jgi:hypothetical protein
MTRTLVVLLWTALSLGSHAELLFTTVRAVPGTLKADKPGYSVVLLDSGGELISGVATVPNTPADSFLGSHQNVVLRVFNATNEEIANAAIVTHQFKESSRLEFSLRRELLINSFISVSYGDTHGNSHFTRIVLGSFHVQTPDK